MNKMSIVGAGRVGQTAAQILAGEELCRQIARYDLREDVPAAGLLLSAALLDGGYGERDVATGVHRPACPSQR
jgi:hypothetical protein